MQPAEPAQAVGCRPVGAAENRPDPARAQVDAEHEQVAAEYVEGIADAVMSDQQPAVDAVQVGASCVGGDQRDAAEEHRGDCSGDRGPAPDLAPRRPADPLTAAGQLGGDCVGGHPISDRPPPPIGEPISDRGAGAWEHLGVAGVHRLATAGTAQVDVAVDDPFSPVVVRGRVVEWLAGDEAWPVIDEIAQKYIGAPYSRDEERVVGVIEPERQIVGVH